MDDEASKVAARGLDIDQLREWSCRGEHYVRRADSKTQVRRSGQARRVSGRLVMSDERRDKSWPQISRCTDLIMPSAVASPHVASWAPALDPCRLVGKVSWESCSAMLPHACTCLVQPETGLLALGSLRARMRESGVLGAS